MVGNRRGVNNSEVVSNSWKNLMEDIGKNLNVFGESELCAWKCAGGCTLGLLDALERFSGST